MTTDYSAIRFVTFKLDKLALSSLRAQIWGRDENIKTTGLWSGQILRKNRSHLHRIDLPIDQWRKFRCLNNKG